MATDAPAPERAEGAGERVAPQSPEQVAEVVRWAIADGRTLEIAGAGGKRGLGRPVDADVRLDLGYSGIVDYQPEELVLTARAGTPLAEIDAALAARNQMLAFEPGDWSGLFASGDGAGGDDGVRGGTLGGVIACNLSGPRRIKSGAARDHLLGFEAVSGRGEIFRSGGRVVKNVTGFDLSKLVAGSFGTLAVLTEVTVRTLPAAEDTRTIVIYGCDEERGIRALTLALQSPHDVSAAAHLPPDVAERSAVAKVAGPCAAVTAIRIEGPTPSVAARGATLHGMLAAFGKITDLDREASLVLWREVGSAAFFADQRQHQIWRLSVPPTDGAGVVAEILFVLPGRAFFDWGGGLIWLAVAPTLDAGQAVIRGAIGGTGGHATLIRAEPEVRARVAVFQPQPTALARLTRRIKEGFDPAGVLNPGRMYEAL